MVPGRRCRCSGRVGPGGWSEPCTLVSALWPRRSCALPQSARPPPAERAPETGVLGPRPSRSPGVTRPRRGRLDHDERGPARGRRVQALGRPGAWCVALGTGGDLAVRQERDGLSDGRAVPGGRRAPSGTPPPRRPRAPARAAAPSPEQGRPPRVPRACPTTTTRGVGKPARMFATAVPAASAAGRCTVSRRAPVTSAEPSANSTPPMARCSPRDDPGGRGAVGRGGPGRPGSDAPGSGHRGGSSAGRDSRVGAQRSRMCSPRAEREGRHERPSDPRVPRSVT